MMCTPYGYCHCLQPATCSYPDCRVGSMFVSNDDRYQPAIEMAMAELDPRRPGEEPALPARALAWGAVISALSWLGVGLLVGLALSEFWP